MVNGRRGLTPSPFYFILKWMIQFWGVNYNNGNMQNMRGKNEVDTEHASGKAWDNIKGVS
jgi:hypothetical protein